MMKLMLSGAFIAAGITKAAADVKSGDRPDLEGCRSVIALQVPHGCDGKTVAEMQVKQANMGGITMIGATSSHDEAVKVGDLEITGAYSKAMFPGQPVGGGYLTIRNTGKVDDTLVSVISPLAGTVEMHEMAMQGEVMRMRRLSGGIDIPAGTTVELTPSGLHLMFMKVAEPFKAGGTVPVTLTFSKAGRVDIMLPVKAAGPGGQRAGDHQHN
jgi:copper(I)-binding protein